MEIDNIDITSLIIAFRNFLNSSVDEVLQLARYSNHEEVFSDWCQANWEILVEGEIIRRHNKFVVLNCYGDGADVNKEASRVLFPEKSPTHEILCQLKPGFINTNLLDGKEISTSERMIFDRFVTIKGKWYCESHPFDCLLSFVNNEEVVLRLDGADFFLEEIHS